MYIIQKRPGDQIKLGRKGEYNARRIALDLSAWQTRYGDNGTVQLLYQRPGDATPYPVTLTREDHLALWTVAAADTANSGSSGRAELRYYIGDALVKSAISQVVVEPSLGEPGDAPDEEQQSWLDQAVQAGSTAQSSAADAASHAATAQSFAESAANSAQNAQTSAESAANSAQTAQTSADTAATSANDAEVSAQNSAVSAINAQNASNQAAASAQNAAEEVKATVDALVDDVIVTNDTLWSSQKIVDYLCTKFNAISFGSSGITCNPVSGSVLNATTYIDANPKHFNKPKPSYSNPLRGWNKATLSVTADTNSMSYSLDFGCTVYGGTLDWGTGLLTITHKIQYFDGTEDWQTCSDGSAWHPVLTIDGISPNPDRKNRYDEECSHYVCCTGETLDGHTTGFCTTSDGIEFYNSSYAQEDPTAWKNRLATLNANGDPLHVVVRLNEPYTVQLDPTPIIAFSGTNSLGCTIESLSISGKQDFRYELQQLKNEVSQIKDDVAQLKSDVAALQSGQ